MEKPVPANLEAPVAHEDSAEATGKALLAATYNVCKDGTIVFPPNKCPENEQRFLPKLNLHS